MKTQIHPNWNADTHVKCACGSEFVTGSTSKDIRVEVCSACHPLWTGQQKFLDTAGRVEKFNQRAAMADKKKAEAAQRAAAKAPTAAPAAATPEAAPASV